MQNSHNSVSAFLFPVNRNMNTPKLDNLNTKIGTKQIVNEHDTVHNSTIIHA